jgi:hypothetical protein
MEGSEKSLGDRLRELQQEHDELQQEVLKIGVIQAAERIAEPLASVAKYLRDIREEQIATNAKLLVLVRLLVAICVGAAVLGLFLLLRVQ